MPLLIINHHYFRTKRTGRGIYPITPKELLSEIENLQKHGWRIGNENDIIAHEYKELKNNDKVAVLTFDDGLKEQFGVITTLCESKIAPIFYIPTLPYKDNKVLPVHKLQMIRSKIADEKLFKDLDNRFNFCTFRFDEHFLNTQYRYDTKIARKIKYFLNFMLSSEESNEWISIYFNKTFGNESIIAQSLYFSKDEIKFLASKSQIGSHAHSHLPLASINKKEMLNELQNSKDIITKISGLEPKGISYPYGGKSSINKEVFKTAEFSGYQYGLTMNRGVNRADLGKNRYSLKRIDVNDLDEWIAL